MRRASDGFRAESFNSRKWSQTGGILVVVKTLGVNCSPHEVYIAVAEDGEVLAGYPERLKAFRWAGGWVSTQERAFPAFTRDRCPSAGLR